MGLFNDKQIVLETLNTEAGRYILGEKDSFPIFKFTDNSYHQIIENNGKTVLCRAKIFPMKYVRHHFEPIFTKIDIANEHKYAQQLNAAFLHFSGLKYNRFLPNIFLDTATLYGNATGTGFLW